MRRLFDEQLALLNKELIETGALCEEALAIASMTLLNGNMDDAKKVAPISKQIDRKERDIEALCLRLLLLQQPVARDLRQISAALKMVTDMERIGDQAEDIAEIISYLKGHRAEESTRIHEMAQETIRMVTQSVDAYVRQDITIAESVILHDDIVDDCFRRVKNKLIEMITTDPSEGEYALDLLMIAKYFERIGDHAVNIAEWVIFSITGIHEEVSA